jgi:hypothetical protein
VDKRYFKVAQRAIKLLADLPTNGSGTHRNAKSHGPVTGTPRHVVRQQKREQELKRRPHVRASGRASRPRP